MPPELQKILDKVVTLTAKDITLELIEPLAFHAMTIEDDIEFVKFLHCIPNNVLARLREVIPALQDKAQGVVDRGMASKVEYTKDDNRFERTYDA